MLLSTQLDARRRDHEVLDQVAAVAAGDGAFAGQHRRRERIGGEHDVVAAAHVEQRELQVLRGRHGIAECRHEPQAGAGQRGFVVEATGAGAAGHGDQRGAGAQRLGATEAGDGVGILGAAGDRQRAGKDDGQKHGAHGNGPPHRFTG
jgi:hypothetical protein